MLNLRPTRRWLRFSLSTFLVFVTLFCIWSAWYVALARRQKEAVAAVRDYGGRVYYDYEFDDDAKRPKKVTNESQRPSWLIETFGVDMFHNVVAVHLRDRSDDAIPHLASFQSLRRLRLIRATDEIMLRIIPLSKLEHLSVYDAQRLNNSGLERLRALPRLKSLLFQRTRFTDESLALISRFSQIESLDLLDKGNRFSDAGLKYLASMANLRHLVICFGEGEFTDEGATHLLNLQRLEVLSLMRARLSTQMQERIKQLPKLKLLFLEAPPVIRPLN